jgi:POT family proton-dependent oligopeptide transporter
VLSPLLLEYHGPGVAFGVPGVLMAIALATFWAGRHRFVHIQPSGWRRFWRETFGSDGLRALGNLALVYVMVAAFWALFDQNGSSWVLQAEKMNRQVLGYEILPSQVGAMNPILVLILIPVFTYGVYPLSARFVTVTPLRKIGAGFFVTTLAFVLAAWIQLRIDAGGRPHVAWQFLAYLVLTAAEVMVSITALELSYTQAPRRMKSVVMAGFMLSVVLGNLFTAAVNFFIANPDGTSRLAGAEYFWFFTAVMLAAALLFVPVALIYRGATFIQGSDEATAD